MKREKVILLISSIITIFTIFDAFFGLNFSHEISIDNNFSNQNKNTTVKNIIENKKPITINSWTKDIFYNRSSVYNSWFRLTGITQFKNGYKAIINGEIVGEMNHIRGFSVEEITKNQVKLERNDYQVILNLEE